MFLEERNIQDESVEYIGPLGLESKQPASPDKMQKFMDAFAGIYVYAGKDEYKQVYYVVMQALKTEGIQEDLRLTGTLTDMIMADQEMLESARLVIQRYGK